MEKTIVGKCKKELEDGKRYAINLFKLVAPQCVPLNDLSGIISQLDNYISGLMAKANDYKYQRDYNAECFNELRRRYDKLLKRLD
jgi:hypothetical protein